MDLRKVQLTGGSSITVTLPKAWVDKNEVRQGDVVGMVEQADGSLAIHPHARGDREPQRYRMDSADSTADYLFRKIIAAYLMGYDAITIKGKGPLTTEARQSIRRAVGRIIGLEVIEEDLNSITVQDFLDPREFHMDKALRRMMMLTQAMQQEALMTLQAPRAETLHSVRDRDDEVDRLYWLVNKQFHAILRDVNFAVKMELTASQALNFLLLARLVERTADHATRVAEQALEVGASDRDKKTFALMEDQWKEATDLFKRAFEHFVRRDSRGADQVIEEAKAFSRGQERLLKAITALGGEEAAHLTFIAESIGRTAAYAADMSEIAINHKVALNA